MEERYFALLIDADNVSAKYITPILTELSKYGVITYKRIYGDWTSPNMASWKPILLENAITPKHLAFRVEGGAADEFNHAGSAVQLHDRKKCNRFSDDYRCNGYPVCK